MNQEEPPLEHSPVAHTPPITPLSADASSEKQSLDIRESEESEVRDVEENAPKIFLSPFREERRHGICYTLAKLESLLDYSKEVQLKPTISDEDRRAFLSRALRVDDESWHDVMSEMFKMTGSVHAPALLGDGNHHKPRWSKSCILNFFELHGYFVTEDQHITKEEGENLLEYLGYSSVQDYINDSYNQP
jgi:hypothetical protein